MTTAVRPACAPWQPIVVRGRQFVATTLREFAPPGSRFVIAQPVGGRYEVGDLFAVGETTLLLRGRDLRTRHSVLIKALRSDLFEPLCAHSECGDVLTTEIRRVRHHLQTERRLLVRLRNAGCAAVPHPNDYVYDFNPALERASNGCRSSAGVLVEDSLASTEPYLILEHVAGTTLDVLLKSSYPNGMELSHALKLLLPVVNTLAVLHEPWRLQSGRTWHCVYQDLKPANLIVDRLGRLRLVDFSGCQVVVDGVPVLDGSFTPGYSAPECEESGRVVLPCADVYGIGSTLYQMLTGVDPTRNLARWRGQRGTHVDLRALRRLRSPGVRELLERCLALKPSDRYAHAHQVAQVLATLVPR